MSEVALGNEHFRVTWFGGVKSFRAPSYTVVEKKRSRWRGLWRRSEFWIETEFAIIGPWRTRAEAEVWAALASRR